MLVIKIIVCGIIFGLGICWFICRPELPEPPEDPKEEDTTTTKTEYPDDELLGLGKKFAREIVDITEDSITYTDLSKNINITVSEPILQFVREVKTRTETFKLVPYEYDYDNYCFEPPFDYKIKDTITGKSFDFYISHVYGLRILEKWITRDESRYLYSVLFEEFYQQREYRLQELQNKRKRNNMKRIYKKADK